MTGGWAAAFALTQLVEVPLYAASLRPHRTGAAALIGFGASALTHPIVWFVMRPLIAPAAGFVVYVAAAEAFAWVAEALFLRATGVAPRRAWLVALSANAASAGTGFLLFR